MIIEKAIHKHENGKYEMEIASGRMKSAQLNGRKQIAHNTVLIHAEAGIVALSATIIGKIGGRGRVRAGDKAKQSPA